MDSDYVRGIERSDTAVFKLLTQSSEGDRRSLLDIQNIVRTFDASYVYLEVGSHLGGTLLPHLMDPNCRTVISVDPRPMSQADERGRVFHYERNSTARMIRNLETIVPRENMFKLKTFDSDMSNLSMEEVKENLRFAFIDGEHTSRACFRDFVSVLPMMHPDSIVAFHDANIVFDALCNIEESLKRSGREFSSMYLPDAVFAIGLGKMAAALEWKRRSAFDYEDYVQHARAQLQKTVAENTPGVIELKARLEELQLEKQQLEHNSATKAAALEVTLRSATNEAGTREQSLRRQIAELKSTLRLASIEIEALKSSTSWRVTAPIRSLRSAVAKRKR